MNYWLCKECNENAVSKRLDGIFECGACGHMFEKQPKDLQPKAKGEWRPEKKHDTRRQARDRTGHEGGSR